MTDDQRVEPVLPSAMADALRVGLSSTECGECAWIMLFIGIGLGLSMVFTGKGA